MGPGGDGCYGHHACVGSLQVESGLRISPGAISQAEARMLTWDQVFVCVLTSTALICQRCISSQCCQVLNISNYV